MSAQGFSRRQRILVGRDFSRCFAEGQKLSSRYFRLHWLETGSVSRLGLAVSRKVDKRAVVRNQIKRAVRESFRMGAIKQRPGDAVVVARREAAAAEPAQLRNDLAKLWRRTLELPAPAVQGTMRAGSDAVTSAVDPSSPEPSPPLADANRITDLAPLPSA